MGILLTVVLLLLAAEAGIFLLARYLRRDFQWLIMPRDQHPELAGDGLQRFCDHGMDPELGWVRKPLTSKGEVGQNGAVVSYSINARGARCNPGFDDKPGAIVAVGDSYTFCRQVNDDETWPHFLSRHLNVNVLNFGVGNYGLDQALLRLKRELPRSEAQVVVLGVVPETICRIQAVWKHYSEYGNTFAFKPRFTLEDGELRLHPNPADSIDRYRNYRDFEGELQRLDRFYREKFMDDLLRFPYSYHLLRSAKRNVPLMLALLRARLSADEQAQRRPFQMVLERNNRLSAALYRDRPSVDLFEALVREAARVCRRAGVGFVFCMFPQLQDIGIMRTAGIFYQPVLDRLRNDLTVIDFGPLLLELDDVSQYYTDDAYGGHFSVEANRLVAATVARTAGGLLHPAISGASAW